MIPTLALGGLGRGTRRRNGGYYYWNPADKQATVTLTDSDRVATNPSVYAVGRYARSLTAKSSGKWRVEMLPEVTAVGTDTHAFGFATSASVSNYLGRTATAWALWGVKTSNSTVAVYNNNVASADYPVTFAVNDVISLIIDIDAGKAWWAKNGTVISGDPVAGTGAMATFTPGTSLFLACAPAGALDQIRLRTDPAEMTAASVSGFTDGWPD